MTRCALFTCLLILCITAAGSTLADETAGENLVRNPSVEEGTNGAPVGWRFWGWAPEGAPRTARGEWDRTTARTGDASLKIVNENEHDVGTWANRHSNAFVPVEPGKIYTVSAWMMVESLDSPLSTNFRCGFAAIDEAGEVTYLPVETRRTIDDSDREFTEAGTWKQRAIAARAPEGATHLGLDIDLIGKGIAWIDDITVTEGYDAAAFGGRRPAATIALTAGPDLDPQSADTPLTVTFEVTSPLAAREVTLECEVIDYWFRPSKFTQTLQMGADEVRAVTVDFDAATRARLFAMRNSVGANSFRVIGTLREDGEPQREIMRSFTFVHRVREYGILPALEPQMEWIDDIFGEQKLVDVIHCYDPDDPHPYIEGGRGMASKSTGAAPNVDWQHIYREPLGEFTSIETIFGRQFRVTHGWGWFGYKFNREGLKPNRPYLVVLEYPEDTGRTYTVFNTGISTSMVGGYGFHTGNTLGDHWTRTLNSEYVDYPLSGGIERWHSLFHLGEKTWSPAASWQESSTLGDSEEGFWIIVGGVGPSQDPLASGAAVSTIKLYEISDMAALFPKIHEPPLELGRRELFVTAESDGLSKFHTDEQSQEMWAQIRMYDACFMGMSGVSPNGRTNITPLLEFNRNHDLGLKVFHRWMIEREVLGRVGIPPEAVVVAADGDDRVKHSFMGLTQLPDILHPEIVRETLRLLTEELGQHLEHPGFSGMMLYRHYGHPLPVSFSEYALKLYEQETATAIPGEDNDTRRQWILANHKDAYYQWWYGKKRDFMLTVRNHMQHMRPDLQLFYFPWHSDDSYPFSGGRLRYSGAPMMDKIYVPGTNILLVPSFTVAPENWSAEEKRNPALARHYYREAVAPELEGKITIEDILYGRYKDMPEFWGAPRSGELPHLLYPHEMDMVALLTEPGGIYANGVGHNPRLFREDQDFIYWAPVRHRFTADNPELLDLFRTGEGSAVAVHMPYNEETSHLNVPSIHGAHGVEHGGPFCVMEEVLSMAHSDPTYIMVSMWEPLMRGFPQQARAFAQAYRALPAMPSTVLTDAVTPADAEIVVRSYETDYGHYLTVINRAFDANERQTVLSFTPAVNNPERIVNLGTGETIPFEQAGEGRLAVSLVLPPMSLTSLQVFDAAPRAVFRDVQAVPAFFSPNDSGRNDTMTLTGRTVEQIAEGRWEAAISNADNEVVRRFSGDIPSVDFTWDGNDANGARCPDGVYDIRLVATAFPATEHLSRVTVDTTAPRARIAFAADELTVSVNNLTIEGIVHDTEPGDLLYLHQKGFEDRLVPVAADNTFVAAIEALDLGENRLLLMVRNRVGNSTEPHELTVNFAFDPQAPIGFDFGAGPIMEGFSAIRNETFYSEERGYGWLRYENLWRGDRGLGDYLIRDYCSGKEDREFAVKLPNGEYTVRVVMVDTRFDHHAPDIYLQGVKLSESQSIKANEPLWVTMQTEVTDGILHFDFKNPGHLPYFALNGIIIERR